MIHTLFSLTRPLFMLDTETTGINPMNDRIIELGFEQWGPEGLVKDWVSLINPTIPIPIASSKIHNIFDLDMRRCQECKLVIDDVASDRCHCAEPRIVPTFAQIAPSLARGFANCDFAGKNVRFDIRILAVEMSRANQPWNYTDARIIDAERLEQIAIPRSLSNLHEKYTGHKHDGAHGALSDVRASTTVIVHQLQTHTQLPRDLDALHKLQWANLLVADGSFRMVAGEPTCMFGKHRGKPMRDVPLTYYDWMLRTDVKFPADVKQLAANAKLGIFPEVTE